MYLTTLLSLATLSTAQLDLLTRQSNNTDNNNNATKQCTDDDRNQFAYVNATTNLTIQGFQPPGFSPRNWTVHVGVRDIRNVSGDNYSDDRLMWIESTDKDENLTSLDLPYTGCIVSMGMVKPKRITDTEGQGEGSCSGVFSPKCYEALLSAAQGSAKYMSGQTPRSSLERMCTGVVHFIKNKCDGDEENWDGLGANSIFGNGTDECSKPGVAEGSLARSVFPLWTRGTEGTLNNFTAYEELVTTGNPFMLVAWLKNTTDSKEQWGDARLMCPMPRTFVEGSRVVDMPSAASSFRDGGVVWLSMAVSGLVMFGLL